jgi:hypothetical protein
MSNLMRWLFPFLLAFAGLDAVACPLCMGAYQSSAGQMLVDMRRAVLAAPTADGSGYRVVEVFKGERPAGGIIAADALHLKATTTENATLLLVSNDGWPMWVSIGAVSAQYADLLRKVAAGKRSTDRNADDWRMRVTLLLPYLEDREPLVAEIAYGEFAAAPYAALLTVKPRLSAPAIRGWLADPKLAVRQPLYLLLLGIAGDARDAAQIERRLDAAWQAGDAAYVGSLIAADLQLRGPGRLSWVDERYLLDPKRSTREIEAALLALSVQGNANATIARERVIESYRKFMDVHPDIAGYVAQDFAAWRYWDAVPEYVALMKSNVRQQYPSRLAIVAYLRQSPDARNLGLELPSTEARASAPGVAVPVLAQ